MDSKGVIFQAKEASKRFGRENGVQNDDIWIGQNYINVSSNSMGDDRESAIKIAEKIPEVISGKIKQFSMEYPCQGENFIRSRSLF